MTDAQLHAEWERASHCERVTRVHLQTATGAFELARSQQAYRCAVALRKALEQWVVTRSQLAAQQ